MWFLTKKINFFLTREWPALHWLQWIKLQKVCVWFLEKQYAHNLQWTTTMWTAISSFALSVEIVLANVIETERNLIAVLGIQLQFWHVCRKKRKHQVPPKSGNLYQRAFSCSNCSLLQERHIADKLIFALSARRKTFKV